MWRKKPGTPQDNYVLDQTTYERAYAVVTPDSIADNDGYCIVEALCDGVVMEERRVNFVCPPAGAATINHSGHALRTGESTNLSSSDGKSYGWKVSPSDAGTFSAPNPASSVTFTARGDNPNCSKNATISMLCRKDKSNEATMDSIKIAIQGSGAQWNAYQKFICLEETRQNATNWWTRWRIAYLDCVDIEEGQAGPYQGSIASGATPGCTYVRQQTYDPQPPSPFWQNAFGEWVRDTRSASSRSAGCCPTGLL
jgi:hypothetical protein